MTTAALLAERPASAAAVPTIASTLLGPLEVDPDARLRFDAGLYGFPDARDFALVPAGRQGLWWLQSADEPALALLLADPFHFFPDYAPDVPDAELAALAPDAAEFTLLVVVTLSADAPTANLRAPVVVDARARRARQVVLPEERRGVREPIGLA